MSRCPPVCFVVRYFTVGGLERVVSTLANALVARGASVRIVVLWSGRRNALISELDPHVDIVSLEGPWRTRARQLRRLTDGRLVHIHFGDGFTHPWIRALLFDRTVVVTYHSVYSHRRHWVSNRIDQLCASRAAQIVAVSTAVRDFCTREVGIDPTRVVVIPNGVTFAYRDTAVSSPQLHVPSESSTLTILALAGLYPHKNQQTLIRAVAVARRAGDPVRLLVVGDGPTMAGLFRLSIDEGVREHIEWYGAIWRRDLVRPLFESASVFVSASHFEGMPLSVLEAMSFGLVPVLSDIPPHHEVAGDAALYFCPNSPEQLAERLRVLRAKPQLIARLGKASLERVRQFNFEKCVAQYLEVYTSLTRSGV